MSERLVQWQEAAVVRERIVTAQLEKAAREVQANAVEIEIKCATQEAHDKLVALGYHYAGQGLFRYGPAPPNTTSLVETRGRTPRAQKAHLCNTLCLVVMVIILFYQVFMKN